MAVKTTKARWIFVITECHSGVLMSPQSCSALCQWTLLRFTEGISLRDPSPLFMAVETKVNLKGTCTESGDNQASSLVGGKRMTTAELSRRCHFLGSVEDLCEPSRDGGFAQSLAGPCGSGPPSLSPDSALPEQPGLGPAGRSAEANHGSEAELARSLGSAKPRAWRAAVGWGPQEAAAASAARALSSHPVPLLLLWPGPPCCPSLTPSGAPTCCLHCGHGWLQ